MRIVLPAFAIASMIAGVAFFVGGVWPPGFAFGIFGLVLLIGTVFERNRYKAVHDRPPPGWHDTGERVVDEKSGETIAVYTDTNTGERAYVRV